MKIFLYVMLAWLAVVGGIRVFMGTPKLVVGVQTHFDGPAGSHPLEVLKSLGFKIARIDAQKSSILETLAMIQEAQQAGLRPLVIVRGPLQLAQLPPDLDYELLNEPDVQGMGPEEYGSLVRVASLTALENHQTLWVGSISNLNVSGLAYLKALGALPDNVKVSVHRYGHGDFLSPHTGFQTRGEEVGALKAIIGTREWAVTEFGYSDTLASPEQNAIYITQELNFWEQVGARFAIIYQLNDGPSKAQGDHYGLRFFDGTWKPSSKVLIPKV